jgi:membrane protease YdiL (CAAX protease family)
MSQNEPNPLLSIPVESFANYVSPDVPTTPEPIGPDNPPWGLGAAILTWLGSVIILFVIQSIMVLGYALLRGVDMASLAEWVMQDKTALFITALSLLPTHILTLVLVWLVVTKGGKYSFLPTIGWEWGRGLRLWNCAGLAIVLLGVGMLITSFMGEQKTQLDEMILRSPGARYAIAFLATFTAPITEEFVYRGVLYPAIQRLTGPIWAVAGVLLLFTVVHVPQYWPNFGVILTIGLLSFFLTAVRAYSGRILPCVVIHTVFNGIQSIIIVLNPYFEHTAKPVPNTQGSLLLSIAHYLHIIS